MPIRVCYKCKKPKDLETEFYKHPDCKDGYNTKCKECAKKDGKDAYQRTPQRTLQGVYERRQRNRQFIWNYYSAHPCVDCGEDDPVVLELDHVSGKKLAGVSQLVHNTRSLKVIEDEIAKCEVVCANCHRRRTAATQGWFSDVA